MTPETFLQLGILALIDSTSIGTLVIPVWLLLRRDAGKTTGKVAAYLAAVGAFYFLVGIVLLLGAGGLGRILGGGAGALMETPAVQTAMIAAGAGMLLWSFKDTGRKGNAHAAPVAAPGTVHGPVDGRLPVSVPNAGTSQPDSAHVSASARRSQAAENRWQSRIAKALDSKGGLLGLALLAGVLELPTMLPYLAAVGLVTASGTGWSASAGILALYCVVMLLPALLLLLSRWLLGRHLDGPLERLRAWLTRVSGEAVLWIVGIVGFLLLRAGLAGLFPGASWNPFGG